MQPHERAFHPIVENWVDFSLEKSVILTPPELYYLSGKAVKAVYTPFYKADAQMQGACSPLSATLLNEVFSNALLYLTRSKAANWGLLSYATHHTDIGGVILIDGQKTDGIAAFERYLKEKNALKGSFIKAHGRVLWFENSKELQNDLHPFLNNITPRKIDSDFYTQPGVFSENQIDKGSALLIETLKTLPLSGIGADFGAGWGYLSHSLLEHHSQIEALHLFEYDNRALECAKLNIKDERAQFHWGNITHSINGTFDFIISNPPFHEARVAEPHLGQNFIKKAAAHLSAKGQFFFVANTHLAYEKTLDRSFHEWQQIEQASGFKIMRATRAKRR